MSPMGNVCSNQGIDGEDNMNRRPNVSCFIPLYKTIQEPEFGTHQSLGKLHSTGSL